MSAYSRVALPLLSLLLVCLFAVAAQAIDCPPGTKPSPNGQFCIKDDGGGAPAPAPEPEKPRGKSPHCSQALANCNYSCSAQPAHVQQQCYTNCQIGYNNCR